MFEVCQLPGKTSTPNQSSATSCIYGSEGWWTDKKKIPAQVCIWILSPSEYKKKPITAWYNLSNT